MLNTILFYILYPICFFITFFIKLIRSFFSRVYDVVNLFGGLVGREFVKVEKGISLLKNLLLWGSHFVNHFPYFVRYYKNIKNYYPKVLSIRKSVAPFLFKIYSGESFIRYADGEEVLMLTNARSKEIDVYFQSFNPEIKKYLIEGLNNTNPNINILIPSSIRYIAHRKNKHIKSSAFYSKEFFDLYANVKNKYDKSGIINHFVIREIYDKAQDKLKLQKYLLNKKVILICNQFVYDNFLADLFLKETHITPIIIPPTNVWDKREDVLKQVEGALDKNSKSDFIVLSMAGMTSIYFVIEIMGRFEVQAIDFGQPYLATIASSHKMKQVNKILKS